MKNIFTLSLLLLFNNVLISQNQETLKSSEIHDKIKKLNLNNGETILITLRNLFEVLLRMFSTVEDI